MLSRIHLIPERNGQTHGQTDGQICYIIIARQYADAHKKIEYFSQEGATKANDFVCSSINLFSCLTSSLSRVSTLTRDIHIAVLSARLSVRLSVTFRYQMKTD